MKCDVVTCVHPARFVYTASLSKRQFYACHYHIAPYYQYRKFGATVEELKPEAGRRQIGAN